MKYNGEHWYFALDREGLWIALNIFGIDFEFHITNVRKYCEPDPKGYEKALEKLARNDCWSSAMALERLAELKRRFPADNVEVK